MKALFGIVIAFALIGAGWYMLKGKSAEAPAAPITSGEPAVTVDAPVEKESYTMEEIATHKDASGCLTVVRGTVYDLTAWIDKHPGGDKNILKLCGFDGTAAFEKKHGGQEKPENALKGFEVGTLAR
jgi:cytochrome b involved in lipid metabolism